MTTRVWLLYVINYVAVPHQTATIPKKYETKLKTLAQIRMLLLDKGPKENDSYKIKTLCLYLTLSTNLPSPKLSARLTCVFTLTCCLATLWKAGLSLQAHRLCTVYARGGRGIRWMPLSVSFTLVKLLPLFNCPVLSTCEYVSPVSHLTDTCPARSNGRTLVGARA